MRILQAALVLLISTAPALVAASSPRVSYSAALAHERSMRSTNYGLKQLRAAIAKYEAVVRQSPRSGYSDNALWQASGLALEAYERYRDDEDRRTAQRLLNTLLRAYPASSLTVNARERLRHLDATSQTRVATAAHPNTEPPARPSNVAPAARTTPAPARADVVPEPAPRTPAPVIEPSEPTGASARAPVPASATVLEAGDIVRISLKPTYVSETPSGANVALRDIKRTNLPNGVRIAMSLDAEAVHHWEELANPRRVFFDFAATQPVPALADKTLRYAAPVVREVRVGTRGQHVTRVVIDLENVSSYDVFVLYNPYRLVVDCVKGESPKGVLSAGNGAAGSTSAPASPAPPAAPAAVPVETREGMWSEPASAPVILIPAAPRPAPVHPNAEADGFGSRPPEAKASSAPELDDEGGTREVTRIDEPVLPVPRRDPVIEEAPRPPVANGSGRFSLARQLGLGISRIVIDPGHGGHDPGARKGRLNEAELVLDIAVRLEKLLLKGGDVEVVMTRRSDEFIPLEQRTALANREQADLFLSIHANASRNSGAHGVETYFLNFASDADAQEVAARENASSGRTMRNLPDIVQAIALNNKLDESRDLAATVQDSMVRKLRSQNRSLRDLGVKRAPFVVLIGATMPSVLAEVAFVTNKGEGQLLGTSKYRQRIAEALFEAVSRYQRSLKSVAAASMR